MTEATGNATRPVPIRRSAAKSVRPASIVATLLSILLTGAAPLLISLAVAGYALGVGDFIPLTGNSIVDRLGGPLAVLLVGLGASGAVTWLLVSRLVGSVGQLAERARVVAATTSTCTSRSSRIAGLPLELGYVAESLDLIAESGRARKRGLGELSRSLDRSRELLTKALANLREGILILDYETGDVIDCNTAISRIFGYDREAIVGHSPDLLHLTKEDEADFRQQMDADFAERGFLRHPGFRMRRKDGSVTYADITAVPLVDESGERFGVMCVIHDVTELRQYERRLAYLASHDQLTGLPTRSGLEKAMSESVAVAADGGLASALLLVDIVHFAEINDALGLQAGDEVLAAVARCIQISLRGTDVAARLGSDEFAVLLRWTEYGAARLVAERLRRTVETEFSRLGAGRFSLKLSIGMALIDGSLQAAGVLGSATAALSEAKRGSGDRIVMTLDDAEPTSRAECP